MKRTNIKKLPRNFGSATDWYNYENLVEVEAKNPCSYCGGKMAPIAFFVAVEEEDYNPMRDYNSLVWITVENAGPFASEETAREFAVANY